MTPELKRGTNRSERCDFGIASLSEAKRGIGWCRRRHVFSCVFRHDGATRDQTAPGQPPTSNWTASNTWSSWLALGWLVILSAPSCRAVHLPSGHHAGGWTTAQSG